jgi:dCTP deaminase
MAAYSSTAAAKTSTARVGGPGGAYVGLAPGSPLDPGGHQELGRLPRFFARASRDRGPLGYAAAASHPVTARTGKPPARKRRVASDLRSWNPLGNPRESGSPAANGGGMSIKADKWIRRMALERRMIEPFTDKQVRQGVLSYGLSSYGYDVRIADEFKIFTNLNSTIVDPKNFDPRSFVDVKSEVCIIPPNSFALARTVEYFRIPRNVLTICVGKSSYARCGIIVNVTPFEPEWEGIVTLEVSNTTPLPAKIYANEGIAQVLFFESDEDCETSYADKKGKYQAQQALTLPRL